MASPTAPPEQSTPGQLEAVGQYDDLVISNSGHAFAHNITNRVKFQRITTHLPSSTPYKHRRGASHQGTSSANAATTAGPFDDGAATMATGSHKQTNAEIIVQPSHPAESQPSEPGRTIDCLVIGLIPTSHTTNMSGTAPGNADRRKLGVGLTANNAVSGITGPLLRVVVEISSSEPEMAKTLICMPPIDGFSGLYEPLVGSQDDIFYFSEFRDGTGSRHERKKSWSTRVKDAAGRLAKILGTEQYVKQKQSARVSKPTGPKTRSTITAGSGPSNGLAQATGEAPDEQSGGATAISESVAASIKEEHSTIPLSTQIGSAVSTISNEKTTSNVDKLTTLLASASKTPNLLTTDDHILEFLNLSIAEISIVDFIGEIGKIWPEVGPILNFTGIGVLRSGMLTGQININYATLKTFLVAAMLLIAEGLDVSTPDKHVALVRFAKNLADLAGS